MSIDDVQSDALSGRFDQDDQLALSIGKLVQACSFIEYWVEINILCRVPERNQRLTKLVLNKANLKSKLDMLHVLLSQKRSCEQMTEWTNLRDKIKIVFEERDLVAHGIFGRKVSDNGYVVHRLRTGDSGQIVKAKDHGIAEVGRAFDDALELRKRLIEFLMMTDESMTPRGE